MIEVSIYALIDPYNGDIRYIGRAYDVESRLREHISGAIKGGNSYKDKWIRKVLRGGEFPSLEILEKVNNDNWQFAEKEWIAVAREAGCKLTNIASGGNGFVDKPQEYRDRQSEFMKGNTYASGSTRTEEEKIKIGKFMKGNTYKKNVLHTEIEKCNLAIKSKTLWDSDYGVELRKKMSMRLMGNKYRLGCRLTEEHKRKISESMKGCRNSLGNHPTEESRKKMSESAKRAWAVRKAANNAS